MEHKKYSKYIDHTILKPQATSKDILKLCSEASEYDFASVCVNPCWVNLCKERLAKSPVKVCTVIGFPLGAATSLNKNAEMVQAIQNGADEIDMVLNIGKLIEGDLNYVTDEIKLLNSNKLGCVLKVIVETALLNDEQIANAAKCVTEAGADFIKTSTGFSTRGASLEDIKIFKDNIGKWVRIKASGGIKTAESFLKFIEAGADRIGTSSGLEIIQTLNKENNSEK